MKSEKFLIQFFFDFRAVCSLYDGQCNNSDGKERAQMAAAMQSLAKEREIEEYHNFVRRTCIENGLGDYI